MDVTVEPSRYEVTAYPFFNDDRYHFSITVERRSADRWAVLDRMGRCWSEGAQKWEHELYPSSRTDEWKAGFRYPLNEALDIARRLAPGLTVNGFTVQDAIAVAVRSGEEGSA
jgi:hypothetical protein